MRRLATDAVLFAESGRQRAAFSILIGRGSRMTGGKKGSRTHNHMPYFAETSSPPDTREQAGKTATPDVEDLPDGPNDARLTQLEC